MSQIYRRALPRRQALLCLHRPRPKAQNNSPELKQIHDILSHPREAAMKSLPENHPPSFPNNHSSAAASQPGSSPSISIPPRAIAFTIACLVWLVAPSLSSRAQNAASARSPLGVYVHVDVPDVIKLYGGPIARSSSARKQPRTSTPIFAASTRNCWPTQPSPASPPACTGTRFSSTTRSASSTDPALPALMASIGAM